MKRKMIAKLFLATTLVLPWLAISTGCTYHERDGRGWREGFFFYHDADDRRDWDDRPTDRRYYDPGFNRNHRDRD
jgi:hypothetical protein